MDQVDEILKGCLSGDRLSQEHLYKMFSSRMFGLCLQYSDNYDDARDILQEGFIKVFTKLRQYDGRGSFEGWIRRIMINTALEKYRSQTRLYPLNDRDVKGQDVLQEDVLDNLAARDLVRLMQQLPPRYRMVFNLYAIEGYSHREVSEIMGISVGTSKSNLSRARQILREKVNRYRETNENIS